MVLEMFFAVDDTQSRLNWSFFMKYRRTALRLLGFWGPSVGPHRFFCWPLSGAVSLEQLGCSPQGGARVHVCMCVRTPIHVCACAQGLKEVGSWARHGLCGGAHVVSWLGEGTLPSG